MEPNTQEKLNDKLDDRLNELEKKIEATYESVEKMRKYMMWTGIITLVVLVLPLLGLLFVIPSFIESYTSILEGI